MPMIPRISCFFDVASAHSFFAFEELIRLRLTRDVTVKFVPVHVASIMTKIAHKMPYYEKVLREYNFEDLKLLSTVYGMNIRVPENAFEKLSNTGTFKVQRFLTYVSEKEPSKFEEVCRNTFERVWVTDQGVHSRSDLVELCRATGLPDETVNACVTDAWTLHVNENNDEAIKRGCFGVPWMEVETSCDQKEQLFGVDSMVLVKRILDGEKKRVELEV